MKKINYFLINGFLLFIFISSTFSQNWQKITTLPLATATLRCVYFKDVNNGIVGRYRTTDGGQTWTTLSSVAGGEALYFPDPNTGWNAGPVKTTNFGLNWVTQSAPSTGNIYGAFFVNTSTGWFCGSGNDIIKTTNGGTNWVMQSTSPTYTNLGDIFFVNANTGYAIGWRDPNFTTVFLKTTNGGTNWIETILGEDKGHNAVWFLDANTGFTGAENIYRTTDGGNSWIVMCESAGLYVVEFHFVNANTGYTANYGEKVFKTTNGGLNWFVQHTGAQYDLYDIFFVNENTGFVCGNNGMLFKTTNGGGPPPPAIPNLLTPANNSTGVGLTPLLDWSDAANAEKYFVQVDNDDSFYNPEIDDSTTISQYNVPSGKLQNNTTYYWRVASKNSNETSEWSSVWSFSTIPASPSIPTLLSPANGSTGVGLMPLLDWSDITNATGYKVQVSLSSGFSSYTVNDSTTTSQFNIPNGKLENDKTYYWRVCSKNSGGVSGWSTVWNFSTVPIGIKNLSTEIPAEFKLYNNYPNPFNPVTKVKFDIASASDTKLLIYDVSGRIVFDLVNEKLNPGTYEVDVNCEGLSSGIYFYKLISGNNIATAKMVLMK
ncbi:MAG: T9SS C-terminal target domain-containing protein [Ignavibacteriae bacterium]|nr:MAG: T9SS C-terminal target domain-containing protein [Ignavibacteriota bacterium]